MELGHSSQGLVRALKAASDPPAPDGLSKLQIARLAWDNSSFYVPNKAEVIVDWILGKFLKEKEAELSLNPILDLQLWNLLNDIVSSSNVAVVGPNSHPLKMQLTALLVRIPVAPILVALFNSLQYLASEMQKQVSRVVASCFDIIWPLAAPKLSVDLALECFGALIGLIQCCGMDEGITRLGISIVSSYKDSLYSSSNKKKVHVAFLKNHLHSWIGSLTKQPTELSGHLNEALYHAGIETLFNLDILRHNHNFNLENVLFEAIKTVSLSAVRTHEILPRLFASYIDTLKKYRGALFSQGSDRVSGTTSPELRDLGMQFYAACQSLLENTSQPTLNWMTKIALLSLVEKERLVNSKQPRIEATLNHDLDQAFNALELDAGNDCEVYAIEAMSALVRIDYDLVIPKLPRILPKILLARQTSQSHLSFLDLLLTYYTKTRKMDVFIESLFWVFSRYEAPPEAYRLPLTGPIFDPIHLSRLSKALQTFLADGQTLKTVELTFGFLKDIWEQFDRKESKANVHDVPGSPKKRRLTETTTPEADYDKWAVRFSLSAHLSITVLTSLPLHSISETTRQGLFQWLNDIQKFMRNTVNKALKKIRKNHPGAAWSYSTVAAAAFRLQYALDVPNYPSTFPPQDDSDFSKLLEALRVGHLLPELRLEIVRSLLSKALSRERDEIQVLFNVILENMTAFKSLETSIDMLSQSTPERWAEQENALVLTQVVVDKWLPVIEYLASPEQLEKLIQILMSVNITDYCQSSTGLRARSTLLQVLRSAHFWELPNIRGVFLAYLSQTVSMFDSQPLDPPLTLKLISTYNLLLLLPVEYLTRQNQLEITRRALLTDKNMTSSLDQSDLKYQALTMIRIFLKRVFSHAHCIEQPIQSFYDTLKYLMAFKDHPVQHPEIFSATLDLIESLFLNVFKTSERSNPEAISEILHIFGQIDIYGPQHETADIRIQSFLRMIKVLEAEFSVINLSKELYSTMCELHKVLLESLLREISRREHHDPSHFVLGQNNLLSLWRSLLSFGKWLGLMHNVAPLLGQRLTSRVLTLSRQGAVNEPNILEEIYLTTFAILLEELYYCPEIRRLSHLNLIMATYLSFSKRLGRSGCQQMDDVFSPTCKLLSEAELSHLLDLLSECLTTSKLSEELGHIIQLSGLLLRDHPKGTLKYMRSFSSLCLNTFVGWCGLIDGSIELRTKTLEFVVQHCIERPAVLRLEDVGGIWTLLTKFLSGSRIHDNSTTLGIFHHIVMIIGALVRLRRDLVTLTLPHLGITLRQLVLCIRSVRPSLGAKQKALITDAQPRWLNAKHPIGVEEVKVLSRLLETLTTKTIPRNGTLTSNKAESLAKPFSKHAAFVLKAYIEAMNDPFSIVSYDLRKELQRGLYALCSMLSDHTRDAMMMAMMNADGKNTMKALWREYEKQRYVGKG